MKPFCGLAGGLPLCGNVRRVRGCLRLSMTLPGGSGPATRHSARTHLTLAPRDRIARSVDMSPPCAIRCRKSLGRSLNQEADFLSCNGQFTEDSVGPIAHAPMMGANGIGSQLRAVVPPENYTLAK